MRNTQISHMNEERGVNQNQHWVKEVLMEVPTIVQTQGKNAFCFPWPEQCLKLVIRLYSSFNLGQNLCSSTTVRVIKGGWIFA